MSVVAVYADGGVVRHNPSPYGGIWACCHVDEAGSRTWEDAGWLLPGEFNNGVVTNNQTEFYALLIALELVPAGWSGRACSDSNVTLLRFFRSGRLNGIPMRWQHRLGRVLARLGAVEPVLLSGHPTRSQLAAGVGRGGRPVSEHNVWCDRRCGELARLVELPAVAS